MKQSVSVGVVSLGLVWCIYLHAAPLLPSYGAPQLLLSLQQPGGPMISAHADFNCDGFADVVITRLDFGTPQTFEIGIVLADGHGGFTDATATMVDGVVPRVQHPREIVVDDFNGDGRPDVFIADHGQDVVPHAGFQNTLLLSTADCRLADGTAGLPQQIDFTHSAAAADVDGDGDIDLYVGNLVRVPPQLWRNDGHGHFSIALNALPASLIGGYTSADFVDVNADGRPDLVLGAWDQTQDSVVLLNDGAGRFSQLPGAMPPKPFAPTAIAVDVQHLDLNHDGHMDLLLAFTKGVPFYKGRWIQVLINNGNGTFRDETNQRLPQADNLDDWIMFLHPVDLDGDGTLDIIAQVPAGGFWGGHRFYRGDAQGAFTAVSLGLDSLPSVFSFVDATASGHRDFLSVSGDGSGSKIDYRIHRQLNATLPPNIPDRIRASTTLADRVRLSWGYAWGATGYEVWRSGTAGARGALLATTNTTTFDDQTPPGTFYYSVRAVNSAGTSNWSAETNGTAGATPLLVTLDRTALQFGATNTGSAFAHTTPAQTIRISKSGTGSFAWTATASDPWVVVTPSSGVGPATLSVTVAFATSLPAAGTTKATIAIGLAGAANSLAPINVALTTIPKGTSIAAFGSLDTPTDGATGVTGAIPFTGWALDDVEVTRVMVCRAAVGAEVAPVDPNCGGAAQIFVGFGTFIDGARTDVAALYPTYPMSTRAGWGFMVLTNMLPNQGNGSYQFFMHAQDRDEHATLLGTRTMTCANASATKPFGTIDTPTQGGPASGAGFINFGWALTPQPKIIPIDGSTITVMVDGAPLGPVDYNHERPDIETLFPGFQNTAGANGAVGFRVIDTTTLTNGLHTISWTVTDSLGITEGIGSRFFTVANGAGTPVTAAVEGAASSRVRATAEIIGGAPQDEAPVLARRGWDLEGPWRWYGVGGARRAVIRGEEVDRFELALGEHAGDHYTGHVRVGEALTPLPIGSQLDAATGAFTWAPGVGFVGRYDLVFVRWEGTRAVARHEVRVILAPKGSGHVGVQVAIDEPQSQQDVGQPFLLAGWAADLDAATGTGIDTLHVWAYPSTGGAPVFLGTPTLGGVRPDVAAVHGDQFREAGFGLDSAGPERR